MTITIDQLIQILMKEETDDAGVRAVVTALRDELTSVSRLRDVQRVFEEILAPREGGSREAGASTRKDEVGASVPGTPTPAAPAPVCEWTPRKYEMGFYATPHGIKFKDRRYDNCGICGLPIAIKSEAAR